MPKCKGCGKKCEPSGVVTLCSYECARIVAEKADKKVKQEKVRKAKAVKKAFKARTRELKEKAKTRAEWFADLQKEVNAYVRYRDKDEPCCTCGTRNDIKYDAGHYRSRGACKELRFELTNIHKQCAIQCNMYGSGMRAEYRDFIIRKYGADHLAWLDGPHPSLKEQFPTIDDIRAEIARYRKLNRDARANS